LVEFVNLHTGKGNYNHFKTATSRVSGRILFGLVARNLNFV